jgi:hypothetical protein
MTTHTDPSDAAGTHEQAQETVADRSDLIEVANAAG